MTNTGLGHPQAVTNYLVPATGNIAGVLQQTVLSAQQLLVDFSLYSLNGVPFTPQSVYIDNTLGLGNVVITSQRFSGFTIASVSAGTSQQVNFPSIVGDTYVITGNGTVNMVWSNAPALPNAAENVTATINSTPTTPVYVNRQLDSGGQTSFNILAGQTTGSSTTNGLSFLRGFTITVSANATLTVAGYTTLNVIIDGYYVYSGNLYLPATIVPGIKPVVITPGIPDSIEYSTGGGTGLFNATLSTALATGIIDINGYFI